MVPGFVQRASSLRFKTERLGMVFGKAAGVGTSVSEMHRDLLGTGECLGFGPLENGD
jgi:hypothetical protein